jgi:hypothetical protein
LPKNVDINMNTPIVIVASLAAWFLAVAGLAHAGLLSLVPGPAYALLVVAGVAAPFLAYRWSPGLQRWVSGVGLERLTLLHAWRIPAAFLFFYYGSQGMLPPLFWIVAGAGDLVAGMLALTRLRPLEGLTVRRIHQFGMADFVAAVGLGLTFTLLQDPRMDTLRSLPMALIPLFGVGISGATHLMAFDLMRREGGDRLEALRPTAHP